MQDFALVPEYLSQKGFYLLFLIRFVNTRNNWENHIYANALHFVYYNFCRVHKTLHVTPAMEAKLTTRPMNIEDIVNYAYRDEIEKENQIKMRKRGC